MTTPEIARRSFLLAAVTAGTIAAPIAVWSGAVEVEAAPVAADQIDPVDQVRWKACLNVARRLVLVGPHHEDLKLTYLKILMERKFVSMNFR